MEEIQLKDICDLDNGYAFRSDDYVTESNTLNCRMSNIRPDGTFDILYSAKYLPDEFAEKYKDYILKDGDLIIAMTDMAGDPKILGVPTVVDTKGYRLLLNQRVGKLRFIKDGINVDYLKLALQSKTVRNYLKNFAGGGVQLNVSKKDILSAPVIMRSEKEQEHIASLFTSVLEIKKKREQELALLDELIKARFVEMFGDLNTNEKGFPMKTVNDVIEFTGGAQPDKKFFEYEPTEENIRLIQIRDYKSDNYITYIPKSKARRLCDANDIMIGRYGPPIFQILKGIKGAYNVALMKATPRMGNREFIRYFLKQDCLFNYLDGLSQRTAGQSGIEMPALKVYPFPYPPLDLQNGFELFVKQIEKSKHAVQTALNKTQLLFDSLMQEYFG